MRRYAFWIILVVFVLLRLLLFYSTRPYYNDGTKLKISGRVLSEPVLYEYSQRIYFQGFKFYLPKYPEVSYGDYLSVEGQVEGGEIKDVKNVKVEESKNAFKK